MGWKPCSQGLAACCGFGRHAGPPSDTWQGWDGWRVTVCAWSGRGGGRVPAPVSEEPGEVADGAGELDLGVDGVVAAVVDVAAEPGEQLGEGGLDEAGAALA